ncbi:MAG TPA: AgmX/PglI C-terminal domain-containing protein [Woeseiaceae bacterium]|nr:AgmX/PglI C-terminal domain-containing protein [Woeseiaceae bacterium]
MTEELSNQEHSIRSEFEKSEQELAVLQGRLDAVNGELTVLAEKAHEFDVLGKICRSLEELDHLGAGDLFWPTHEGPETRQSMLANAQRKIDDYSAEIGRVEDRRDSILDQIGDQNRELDHLHYNLLDIVEQQELRKNEWLVERDADDMPAHTQVMPWSRGNEEDKRFRKSLGSSLAASIALAVLLGSIAIPIIERNRIEEVPERVARLVQQNRAQPEPQPDPEPVFEEIPEPEPEALAETLPEETIPVSEPTVAENVEVDTKAQVKSKGILAFRDSFADRSNLRASTQLGSSARLSNAGENAVGRPSRSMVTTNAPGSSGGINLADISRDVGGGGQAIAGVNVSRVSSSIGTGGDGSSSRPLSGGAYAGRTDEEIQIVFDRYKSSLYRLYNRELRKNPTLRGQITLKLTIEPDGSVSYCVMQSSDMNAPALAEQVVERVIGFDFGAKEDIVAVTIIYPIDFLPAA